MSESKKFSVYLMATLPIVFWGASFAAAKVALEEADPLLLLFLRFAISLPLLLALAWRAGEAALPTKKQALVLIFMGFMGFYFHLGIQTMAMRTSGSGTANWQMAASPAAAALMSAIFLKEHMSRTGLLGALCAFLGVTVVLGLGTKGAKGISSYNFGDFLITVSMLNWAAFMVVTRWLFHDGGYPPLFTIFWEVFFAALMCAPTLALLRVDVGAAARFGAPTWEALLVLGLLCSGLAYAFWYRAAAAIPVPRLMVFQFLQPLVGVVAGYFVIGERFTPWLIVGGAMIIAGVYVANSHK
ncbi:DMT family transporter [Synergistes jonesii]|uniref:DMT family transporter n=1 Tax=Synergistes jonesii TaxID=2754 RepID=UPI00248DFD42|nr:DMT family transporter [Synergistes jonesii]